MKLKRYVNGAWAIVDKELKQLTTATDSAASPISITAPLAEPFDNYRVYGTSEGVGDETENLFTEEGSGLVQINSSGYMRFGKDLGAFEAGTYTLSAEVNPVTHMQIIITTVTNGIYSSSADLTLPYTFTLSSAVDKLIVRTSRTSDSTWARDGYTNIMLVEGSTAPTTYIPYGYQIPLNVTYPNLFDKNATDTSNGYVANRRNAASTGADYANTDIFISEYISVIPNTVYTLDGIEVVAGSSVAPPGVCYYDANHVFLSGVACRRASGKWLFSNYQITTPANAAYIRINVSYDTADTAMLTRTDTAPSAYIPHDITTPIYIGSSKLYEDEYLDYQEQKVYKKKPNLVSGIIQNASVNSSGKLVHNDALNSAVTPIEQDKTYTMLYARASGATSNMICGFFENYPDLNDTTYNGSRLVWNGEYRTFTAPTDGYLVSSCSIGVTDHVVYEGEYPQLVPTDPPVPFPSVQHYEGESTTSVDTTVAPDKLELTYQGWRVAANPEPKFYHNGQWMTEYRRVEYLKSTGTQAITTNIVPLSTTRTELDIKFGSDVKGGSASGYERGIFGAAEVDGSNSVKAQYIVNALKGSPNSLIFYNRFTWHSGISANYLNNPDNFDTADNAKQTVAMQGGIGSWGSTSIDFTSEMLDWPELTIPLVVFGVYNAAGGGLLPFQVKELSVYEMRTYDNNILTHNLIPVERQIDGVLGLYDTITDTFYTNSGTGTFVKGGYI